MKNGNSPVINILLGKGVGWGWWWGGGIGWGLVCLDGPKAMLTGTLMFLIAPLKPDRLKAIVTGKDKILLFC